MLPLFHIPLGQSSSKNFKPIWNEHHLFAEIHPGFAPHYLQLNSLPSAWISTPLPFSFPFLCTHFCLWPPALIWAPQTLAIVQRHNGREGFPNPWLWHGLYWWLVEKGSKSWWGKQQQWPSWYFWNLFQTYFRLIFSTVNKHTVLQSHPTSTDFTD